MDEYKQALKRIEQIMLSFPDDDLFEAFFHLLPVPAWIKIFDFVESEFRMIAINKAYCERFSVSAAGYIGSLDSQVWDSETAQQFRKNDLSVIETGNPTIVIEKADGTFYDVLKFPAVYKNEKAVCGLVLAARYE